MLLTVDVGNTNIVLGGFQGDEIGFVSRLHTDRDKMSDEYSIALKGILEYHGFSPKEFDGAILSSVVPSLLPRLKNGISHLLGCRVLTVGPGTKTGLDIKIDDPSILGSDLVCGAVGAKERYSMPCVIVDLGTATKFSVLDQDGRFLGGPILAGVTISLEALASGTAQLPHVGVEEVDHVIGTNSVDSIQAGVLYGTVSMIDGMLQKIEKELGKPVTAIMTGGLAKSFVPYCEHPITYDENLLLYGLKAIYEKNKKQAVEKIFPDSQEKV